MAPIEQEKMRRALVSTLQIVISLALIVVVVRFVDFSVVWENFKKANPTMLLLALVCLVIQQVVAAARWRLITQTVGRKYHSGGLFRHWAGLGLLSSLVLPSTVGGDLIRSLGLAKKERATVIIQSVVIDRAVGLIGLALVLLFAATSAPEVFLSNRETWPVLGVAIGGVLVGVLFERLGAAPQPVSLLGDAVVSLSKSFRGAILAKNGRWIVAASLLVHVLSAFALGILAASIGLQIDRPLTFTGLVLSALLVSAIPISIGGWGVREVAMTIALGLISVSADEALFCALAFGGLLAVSGGILVLIGSVELSVSALLGRSNAKSCQVLQPHVELDKKARHY